MPVNSTQNTAIHGFDGTTWDKVHINTSGHLKCNVENDVNISNLPSDPATGTKQDTQIAQTLVKDGFSQVLLTSAGGTAVKADTTALVQNDPENREGWNIVNNVAGSKFNFYFFGGANEVITLGQIQSVYWKGFVNINTEFSSMPFIHIYTKPTGSGDAGGFYHSKITYEYNNDNTIGIGEECVYYGKATPSTLFNNRKVALNNVITEGDGDDAEEVLYMVVASNSGATQDAVNNTINLMGFNTALVKRNLFLITETTTQDVSGSVIVSNNQDPATGSKQDIQTNILSSLEGKITQGADTTLTTAQQVLVYGEVTAGAGIGDLHPIHISQSGDVQVEIAGLETTGQELMTDSLPVVIASDQSTVNVQIADVVNQGSENNIANNETITAGSDGTGNADVTDMKNAFLIYEDSSTASYDYVAVLVSGNSGSNYHEVAQIYPTTDSTGLKRVGYLEINLGGLTNIKIKNASSTDTYNNVYSMVYGAP